MLIRAQELWFHEPAVTTPVLKLFAELAQNRFDVSAFLADLWYVFDYSITRIGVAQYSINIHW